MGSKLGNQFRVFPARRGVSGMGWDVDTAPPMFSVSFLDIAMSRLTAKQIEELGDAIRKKVFARDEFFSKFGMARIPQLIGVPGGKFVAIGGAIYRQEQEGEYGLLNVFHDCALDLFGVLRLEAEEAKPFEEMHPALQWMHWLVQVVEATGASDDSSQIGWGAAWIRLGYDLFTVRDNAQLMRKLSKELIDPGAFQSARFELKVAAIALTAGVKTVFEDETNNRLRHPEFVGVDLLGSGRIAVEAKSRRRHGVLGFTGGHRQAPAASVGVRNLLVDAFAKTSDLPLYVCVDLNLPPGTQEDRANWVKEMHQTLDDLAAEGYLDDERIHGVLFMNDPSHYVGTSRLAAGTDNLWVLPVKLREYASPGNPRDMLDRLLEAHHQRVVPPSTVPE